MALRDVRFVTSRSDLDSVRSEKWPFIFFTETSMSVLRSQFQSFYSGVGGLHHINSALRSLIDKPNVHRLVELVNHTIPIFGHVRMFS